MQTDFPFSRLFGRADSREACVSSSAKVYGRLVENQLGSTNLQFATLAKIATTTGGDRTQQERLKRLINLFRPNKDKELTLLDFTRVRRTCHHLLFRFGFAHLTLFSLRCSLLIQYIESCVHFRQVLATRLQLIASSK
jgi:hypothetical protein